MLHHYQDTPTDHVGTQKTVGLQETEHNQAGDV